MPPLAYWLADREFVGRAWVEALRAQPIPVRLRRKAHARIRRSRSGEEAPLLRAVHDLQVHEQRGLRKPCGLWGQPLYLSAKRLEEGEWRLIARDAYAAHAR